LSKSTPDSNKFYSILLDTRASTMSENMFDTAEKLLQGEKDNAKSALDHLWALKKNMQNQDEASTVDLLIQFYQNKIDILQYAYFVHYALMQCDAFLEFRSLNLVSQFLKHPFLQIGRDDPTRFANHSSQVDGKKARATTQIQDSHSFFYVGSQYLPRIL